MISEKFQNIIIKYLNKQASFMELEALEKWLEEDASHQKYFINYVKINYLIDLNVKEFDTQLAQQKLEAFIKNEKKVHKLKRTSVFLKYAAAIVIGIVSTNYFLKDELFPTQQNNSRTLKASKSTIEVGTDKAVLTLEDGSNIALTNGNSFQTKNATSNGKEIVYSNKTSTKSAIAYNYLTVPRGGQFFIKLSDGTQVWLNSESQLKYPVSFIDGELRKVELVYGEAYFNVSPSTQHKGSKFSVINKSQEITVLGTEFNVKAYKDESAIYTTLVEGSVAVAFDKNNQKLLPNQQLKLNISNNSSSIKTIDVEDEISWKNGIFSFRKKSLEDIMKVLSRWYDLDVKFENNALKNAGFNGIIGKDQKIEEILEIIKNYGILKEYEIKEKTVILK
ncbi:FecR family protein [Polaribacter sp.]|uniref:FecR family protein n=1 Tax=Polaribacter sp. TaxID=1920175 RepID=UPI004047977E